MDNIRNSDVYTLATESHDQKYTKQNIDNSKQIDNSYDIKSADFYHMEKLSSGFNEIWDTKSLEKELFKPNDDYNEVKVISADKLISDYVTVYDKQGLNDLKDKYGSVTSSAPNRFIRHTRPVLKSFGTKHKEFRKKSSPNQNKNFFKDANNNGPHASNRVDTNIGYPSKKKIPLKQSKKPVKEIAANNFKMFSKNRKVGNALMHRKPRLQAFKQSFSSDRRNIQKKSNAQNLMKRNGFSSRQGVGDVTNILGDTIRNSIPFVGNNIADLIFPTKATSQRPDPSFGTERQALLSGDGYDQMLVLLRPPPRRQPLSLLSQYIDIDYELFVILLGIAGAGAAFALNQVNFM